MKTHRFESARQNSSVIIDGQRQVSSILAMVLGGMVGCALLVSGCVSKRSEMGVQNQWRDAAMPAFEKGRTTQTEVMRELGPPSQVIGLPDQTLFYYLREESRTQSQFYLIYNQTREQILYDRAIFFFNKAAILTDFSYSHEAIPLKK